MISEALKKRIADREAAGWKLTHWVMKDKNGLYFVNVLGKVRWPGPPTEPIMKGEKVIPVFTRTVKIPRGHSFSWALNQMRKGKKVRRSGWDKTAGLTIADSGVRIHCSADDPRGVPFANIPQHEILANDWMLAE